MSRGAPEPSARPPTRQARASKRHHPIPLPPSLPRRPNGGGGPHGSWCTEASAPGVHGHCHPGKSFSQLQTLCSSFKTCSSFDQLPTHPRRWPELRVQLQGLCTSLLQVRRCGWAVLQEGQLLGAANSPDWYLLQMILSSLKEKPEGRQGPGRLAPSVMKAGQGLGTLRVIVF